MGGWSLPYSKGTKIPLPWGGSSRPEAALDIQHCLGLHPNSPLLGGELIAFLYDV